MKASEDTRSRIEAANREWMSAFKRTDAGALASLYTSQGQLLPANSDFVKGTDAIRVFWQGAFDMGLKEAVLDTLDVEVHGDTAIETGQYRLLVGGGSVADSGKYSLSGRMTAAGGSSIATFGRPVSRAKHHDRDLPNTYEDSSSQETKISSALKRRTTSKSTNKKSVRSR